MSIHIHPTDARGPAWQGTLVTDGPLYGTTVTWGEGVDTIFKMSRDGVIRRLHTFPDDPARRSDLVPHPDGNLYGTTIGN